MGHETHHDNIERLRSDAVRALEALYAGLVLTADEERFVEDAARKFCEYSLEVFPAAPRFTEMRFVVVVYAMGAVLGADFAFNERFRRSLLGAPARPPADAG